MKIYKISYNWKKEEGETKMLGISKAEVKDKLIKDFSLNNESQYLSNIKVSII